MPFYSDLSSGNMYYSGMPSYSSGSSYGYSGSSVPLGVSFSASYLNPGGNYSTHSSLGGYGRTPLPSRWISTSRAYSPMLSTISERGTSSPTRISSPRRRVALSSKTYTSPSYSPRPININTADIDVSRDKYRTKCILNRPSPVPTKPSTTTDTKPDGFHTANNNDPFMPRVDGKPETGIDSSPGQRNTIHRGRPVVRLYTVKRRERDSPRKPQDELNSLRKDDVSIDGKDSSTVDTDEKNEKGTSWRDRFSEDLIYKEKRQKKTIAEKLVEKFKLKDENENNILIDQKSNIQTKNVEKHSENNTLTCTKPPTTVLNKSPDRRCSLELLAEQANLLDSLIRGENLSTATLDLSKLGTDDKSQPSNSAAKENKTNFNKEVNRLQTTKSDHSLHSRLKSSAESKESQNVPKRRSLKKSSSGGNIRRLDSITEFAKESILSGLPVIEENRLSLKSEKVKPKPKLKQKITSSVETTQPTSPLKFRVENVIVEEKIKLPKKEIIFSSAVDNSYDASILKLNEQVEESSKINKTDNNKKRVKGVFEKKGSSESDVNECDFWDKIGKRETVYINKRKDKIQNDIKNRREMFWCYEKDSEGDDRNEKECNSDALPEEEQCLKSLSKKPSPEVIEKYRDIDLSSKSDDDFTNTAAATVTLINDEKDTTTLLENKQADKLDSIVNSKESENVLEDITETTQLERSSLGYNIQVGITSVLDQSIDIIPKITDTENNQYLKEEYQGHNSAQLVEKNEADINLNIDNKENMEITDKSVIEPLSGSQTEITEQLLCVKQHLQKEEIVYYSTNLNKSCTVNSIQLHVKIQNAVITIVDEPEHLNKNTTSTIISPGVAEGELISNELPTQEIMNEKVPNENELLLKTNPNDLSQSEISINSPIDDIPKKDGSLNKSNKSITENIGEENKADDKAPEIESSDVSIPKNESQKCVTKLLDSPKKRPVKDEPALRPLIATPRPLQKKNPQVIHSSTSSESSSEEESSEDDNDADDSDDSEECPQFYDCESNPDGRTSTGSNDSGFDSSAPTSPAGFAFIKKDCDVNCHRKCEKLTANLCGVNQRLLVEALATRSSTRRGGEPEGPCAGGSTGVPTPPSATDIHDQELESSTAYGLFRKTGRFTPPARSIPRFRKYTIDDFHFIKVLGKGSFGKVLLAELRDTEYYYAVKCLKKDVVLEDDDVECTLIERKVLALGTNHPYLCHLFATFQTDSHLFFVMEYLNGGDLMFHIQQSGRFPEPRARFYAAEIVSGLKFLHKKGIVYRDLKLDNILLDFEGHVRIADFGMCKLQIYLDKTADTFCGTPDYMAPEIIKGLKYNQAVDWWSFGVLLYEMLIGQSPFSGCDEDELFWSICNEMPSYPRFLSTEALSILTRLLDKDARTRLGGAECMHGDVRDQDFFRPVPWERLERRDLETPFKPRVRHPLDTQYFDRAFTGERPRLTVVEPQVLRSMDQEPFRGFSYTNPNATDR